MRFALCTIAVFLGLSLTAPAWAHAHLKSAEPADGATVAAPDKLTLHFSEDLNAKTSHVELAKDGAPLAIKTTSSTDPQTMTVVPTAPLARGTYIVTWTAIADTNGHKTSGSYTFTVK